VTRRDLIVLLLLFIPSAWFAWDNRDMPNFGYYHDDGVYFSAAKSIAQSGSYRIESLPGTPYQTKYPPFLPAWHAMAWLIEPSYPQNLHITIWLQWIWLPAFAICAWLLARQWGFEPYKRWIIVAAIAISPYPLFFSTAILSEIPFGTLVAACLLLLARGRILPAALIAVLAFLTRTAGIALLVSVPAILLLEKKRKEAAQFVAILLPVVIAWFAWAGMHRPAGPLDDLTAYYVDYLGYHLRVFSLADAHLFLWKNFDFLLQSAGSYLLPVVVDGQIAKITTQVFGVAAIVGAARLSWTNPAARQYGAFVAVTVAMLLAWSFPPNERFLLPILPLLLAGYITEFSRVAIAMKKSFRHRDLSQRLAGYTIAAAFAALICFGVYTQLQVRFLSMPASMDKERERARDAQPMYDWIRQNMPADTKFLVAYDTPFYLSTGRRGSYQIVSPGFWYRDQAKDAYKKVEEYARANGFPYIVWTPLDRRNDTDFETQVESGRILAKSSGVKLVREFRNIFLFEVISPQQKTPAEHSQARP
jgi:hypothetical protein